MGKKGNGSGGGLGGSVGIGNFTLILIGSVIGFVADAMWYSLRLPGTTTALAPACSMLTDADAIQLMIAGGFTLFGFITDIKFLRSLSFGMMAGMMVPKIITPYFHLPRYVIFNYDPKTGSLSPINK